MLPVLHQEDVRLVHDEQLDAGEEIAVTSPPLLTILPLNLIPYHQLQPKGRGYDDVTGVEISVELERGLCDTKTKLEIVVTIAFKGFIEILWLELTAFGGGHRYSWSNLFLFGTLPLLLG